jgi:hypothetical protein
MTFIGATQMRLSPSSIRFSQNSISREFSHGVGASITELFRQVVAGEISVDNVEKISVFRHEDSYWVYRGNRRLFVFQKLETRGIIKSIVVNIVPSPFVGHDYQVDMHGRVLNLGAIFVCLVLILSGDSIRPLTFGNLLLCSSRV